LDRSPLFTGAIRSVGPRYCPSFEDKVVRFADRDRHQIFVEPEGLDHPWIYLNGLSMSLPEEIQASVVRSIPGLERAEMARAEYRLLLDIDSADLRLTDHGRLIGLIGDGRYARFLDRKERVRRYTRALETKVINPTAAVSRRAREVLGVTLADPTTPARLLRRSDVSIDGIERFLEDILPERLAARERRSVENRMRYGGYIEKQERDLERLHREEGRRIP